MPNMVEVQLDKAKLRRIEMMLAGFPNALPKVVSRALNKVATAGRTKIVRAVAAETTLRQGELRRKNIKLTRATYTLWRAIIRITGGRIPLRRFGARQTRRGISYQIRRSDGRKKIAGVFIARMPGGHEGVYRRRPDESRAGGRVGRLPIDELFGPSVGTLIDGIAELARRTLQGEIDTKLEGEVDRQVGVIIQRHRRRRAG